MKVKDLIKILMKFESDEEVFIQYLDDDHDHCWTPVISPIKQCMVDNNSGMLVIRQDLNELYDALIEKPESEYVGEEKGENHEDKILGILS